MTAFRIIIFVAGIALLAGCESVHQGAKEVGQPVGSVTRLPNSVMEGAAEGVAGKPTPNPYNR
jgi:hypothetical protein